MGSGANKGLAAACAASSQEELTSAFSALSDEQRQKILAAIDNANAIKPTKKIIALVSTSASDWEGHKTGLWIEELACPYYMFLEAGFDVDIVSIKGGEPPVDEGSRGEGFYTEEAKKFDKDDAAQAMFKASKKIEDICGDALSAYSAIVMAGGHGTCADFPNCKPLIECIEKMYADGKVVAADCHGPVALFNCKKPNGEPLVKGLDVTGFSNTEEGAVSLMDKAKAADVVIEDKFIALEGKYSKGDDWTSKVCVAGNLVTGQNPQSSKALAEACITLLK